MEIEPRWMACTPHPFTHTHTHAQTCANKEYIGMATKLKKPHCDFVMPAFVRSIKGDIVCPRLASRSPCVRWAKVLWRVAAKGAEQTVEEL